MDTDGRWYNDDISPTPAVDALPLSEKVLNSSNALMPSQVMGPMNEEKKLTFWVSSAHIGIDAPRKYGDAAPM